MKKKSISMLNQVVRDLLGDSFCDDQEARHSANGPNKTLPTALPAGDTGLLMTRAYGNGSLWGRGIWGRGLCGGSARTYIREPFASVPPFEE
jgi:hypothetical protein